MAYSDSANKTKSEKRTLAHLEPTQKLVLWTLDSGAIYKRSTNHFCIGVANNGTDLSEASSAALSAGEFYYDAENSELYIRLSDDSNPQAGSNYVVATYRLFFSDSPIILPHDLTESGILVEYEPIIDKTSNFPQEIDNTDQIGIALESNGSISFSNKHGHWDNIFDKLFFENKNISIYSYLDLRPITENRVMFKGIIENKDFKIDSVSFRLKDFVHELREEVPLPFFSASDGDVSESVIGRPKRLLYGLVDGVKLTGVDNVLNGYDLTGSVVAQRSSEATVTGVGTLFTSELSIGDLVEIDSNEYEVKSIASNLSMVIKRSEPIDVSAEGATFERIDFSSLSGVVTATAPTTTLEGTGTNFTGQLTTSDTIRIAGVDYDVDSITDADTLITEQTIAVSFSNQVYTKKTKVSLTGTVSFDAEGRYMTGSGTNFIDELSIEDEISIPNQLEETLYKIEEVRSNTLAILAELPTAAFSGSVQVRPNVPYRRKNRKWHVAGHKLRAPSTTITRVLQLNRFEADTTDFFEGDAIDVNGETAFIKRISEQDNLFILRQNLSTLPSIGNTVSKKPISKVYFNKKELLIDRDFSITNNSTECYITLDNLAEFNIAREQSIRGVLTFSNASNAVTGTNTFFTTYIEPRDWIKSTDINHTTWYEVLEVIDDTNLTLRTAYAGGNFSGQSKKKNVIYVNDDSIITADCTGKENTSGDWVKTASDAVKDLLSLAGITDINTASFSTADAEAPQILSLKLPLRPDGARPKIKDVITLVNKSVFGSLYVKSDWSLAFSVLSSEKPTDLVELADDDQIKWSVSTRTNIARRIYAKYRHFDADKFTGEVGSAVYEYENTFVDRLLGNKASLNEDIYLYYQRDAETMAQRYALLNSLTQSIVTVQGKLNLTLKNINDKIFIKFDRLYKRFGTGNSNRKIGIISKISRGGQDTSVGFTDLGNIFNRVANIADTTANDFTASGEDERILIGYIVDNDTELPNSSPSTDDEWNTNLIG